MSKKSASMPIKKAFTICPLHSSSWLISGEIGGRPLYLPVLRGAHGALLLDTGCASDVETVIIPALKELDISPSELKWILVTHCDVDHQGGNAGMKNWAPNAMLGCGAADRETVESPENLMRNRYDAYSDEHRLRYDEATRASILAEAGARQPVDVTFTGGEGIHLGNDWWVQVVRLPGHSRGHLGVYDSSTRTLYGGDAVHGAVYHGLDGSEKLCPTYLHVRDYLETVDRVESMPIEVYTGCHWPIMRGRETIARFCRQSRDFVAKAETLILDRIQHLNDKATLEKLCLELGASLGNWPEEVNSELRYAFHGHLVDLTERGLIETVQGSVPVRYRRTTES